MSETHRGGRAPQPPQQRLKPLGSCTHLLGIGINAYAHWPRLHNAVRDVQAVARLLETDYGLLPQHIHLLLDEAATYQGIIEALERMADQVKGPESLIIYYAGHGHLHRERGYWAPVDARRGAIPGLIPNSTLRDYIADIPSLHTLLLSDACFSGTLFVRSDRAERGSDLHAHELAGLASRWIICSGRHDETVSDGPPGGHSPFAQSILDVLGSSARDYITANFLQEQVMEQTRANYRQLPDGGPLTEAGHRRGQYVFVRGRNEAAAWQESQAANTQEAYAELTKQQKAASVAIAALATAQAELTALKAKYEAPKPAPPKDGLVLVKGGTFEMGDVLGDKEFDNETVHRVTLNDFYIGQYAVTFAEYDRFCKASQRNKPADPGWGRDQSPVINVSWYDAIEYCNWLSEQQGLTPYYTVDKTPKDPSNTSDEDKLKWTVTPNPKANGYRLPTEAEWEYAAREGGKKIRFGNGKSKIDPKDINFNASESFKKDYSVVGKYRGKPLPVGSLNSPNALGLHDMSGNVWEWCWDWDWFGSYLIEAQINPQGADKGTYRVLRGGGWDDEPHICRAAARVGFAPTVRWSNIGFRLARS